jgi:hypothetical protein
MNILPQRPLSSNNANMAIVRQCGHSGEEKKVPAILPHVKSHLFRNVTGVILQSSDSAPKEA